MVKVFSSALFTNSANNSYLGVKLSDTSLTAPAPTGIVGSVAGDDTVLLVLKNSERALTVEEELRNIFGLTAGV